MVHRSLAVLLLTGTLTSSLVFAKDIRVDAAGGGDFRSVQEAIDSIPEGNSERVRLLIAPGEYRQRITVPKEKPMISFIGQGAKPEDTVIVFNLKASDPNPDGSGNVGTTGSSSVFIHGADFVAENLTFANSAGDNVGQAVAIKTTADRLVFNKCRFLGFQDTLYPTNGRVYFKDCYITGDTDFIFGNATAFFETCQINSSDGGYITAANTKPETEHGFVFYECILTASDGVRPNSVFLGRPWQWDRGPKAAVAFIRTRMGPHIAAAGWHPWARENTNPGETSRYVEYGSIDYDGRPIDVSKRVEWSKQLSDADVKNYTIEKVLGGPDGWDPKALTR